MGYSFFFRKSDSKLLATPRMITETPKVHTPAAFSTVVFKVISIGFETDTDSKPRIRDTPMPTPRDAKAPK